MKLKLYILLILYINTYSTYSQNYESCTSSNENKLLKYARQLYFCVTIHKRYNTFDLYIKNATLYSGKWTADRYSDNEIDSPKNKTIMDKYTICCKERDNYKFGPAGRIEIHVQGYTDSYDLYIWWDIAKLEYERYGFSMDGRSPYPLDPINLDKNWLKIYL